MNAFIGWISIATFAFSLVAGAKNYYITSEGNFKKDKDRDLVYYQLETFAKECTFVSSSEEKIVNQLENVYDRLIREKKKSLVSCYDESLPKMKSVHYLYKKLCRSLNYNGIPLDNGRLISQFVSVTEYQDGISLFHVVLNDCLKNNLASLNDIVPKANESFQSTGLSRRLESINKDLPFFPNSSEIR
jgi:hypothetical protein